MSDFVHWVTHGVKRGRFEIGPRTTRYVLALVGVLTSVAVLYLMLVSRTVARGRHIDQLRSQAVVLQRDNRHLEVQVAKESAVVRLFERARALGFGMAEAVERVSSAAEDGAE